MPLQDLNDPLYTIFSIIRASWICRTVLLSLFPADTKYSPDLLIAFVRGFSLISCGGYIVIEGGKDYQGEGHVMSTVHVVWKKRAVSEQR
jgi:hypothetical protein